MFGKILMWNTSDLLAHMASHGVSGCMENQDKFEQSDVASIWNTDELAWLDNMFGARSVKATGFLCVGSEL